ncbi:hypothetical protein EXN66_Car006179 [Channa argus]|uniref:Uncharacterized protein n=1 Tax=Channa argus TaxID=215402 RepID=A0A6G1PKH2_CHAAH|nr:hypothetical protein EXN66_Car006179 [Channa argus]KAK2908283.1 hypothetical protein Q8A73_009356 [Channa argus]
MNRWGFPSLFLGLAVFLLNYAAQASAKSKSALSCSVMHQPDGSFLYQLSKPLSFTCETFWEDDNHTVIARDSNFDENLIVALTNQSITLRNCRDHLHHTRECNEKLEDAHCRVNCSGLPEKKPMTTVNSTLICISRNWCLDEQKVILGIIGIVSFFVGISVVLYFICKRRRRRRQESAVGTVSYAPATQQIKSGII